MRRRHDFSLDAVASFLEKQMKILSSPLIVLMLATAGMPWLMASPVDQLSVDEVVFFDDFETDLSQWVVEQMPGGTAGVIDGKLDIDDVGGCTVWFKQKIGGSVLIEFDVTMIKEGGANDRVSDLNFFWMATDPVSPRDFFANSARRHGDFKNYHPLQLYYVGYGANDNTSTRFRRYPGDGSRPVLPEHDLSGPKLMNVPNKTIHLQVIADQNRIGLKRDGDIIFDFFDRDPFQEGWFGFRTLKNHMRIDQFRVRRIKQQL